jgi:hypothetical protein
MKRQGVSHGLAVCILCMGMAAWAAAAPEPPNLVPNGGFEELTPAPGVPETGGKFSDWLIKGGNQQPAGWTLSGWFMGELTVMSKDAPEGKTYLHITATMDRGAHLHQACTGIKPGFYYRMSMRYRGGPVSIMAYEYPDGKSQPAIVTLATGEATAATGAWSLLEGGFVAPKFDSIRIVAGVAGSTSADIDDLRIWRAPLPPTPTSPDTPNQLNVRNHGVVGTNFETTAKTTAGSKDMVVASPGDLRVGQQLLLSKCNPKFVNARLRGPRWPSTKAPTDEVELRGYDGSAGDWLVYTLEVDGANPATFRWSDDLRKDFNARGVPITGDWQPLSRGVEVRFKKDGGWAPGDMLTFTARDRLVTTIEKIEESTVTLKDAPGRSTDAAQVRHCDSDAMQAAISQAIREGKNVLIPAGRYLLVHGLQVENAKSILIEGTNAEETVLDISEGEGSVLWLSGGTEVTVRDLSMVGHTGLADRPRDFRTMTGTTFWRCNLKSCNASSITGTERVLFENVHASRMASECFYCQEADGLKPRAEKRQATLALTFLRCSVDDCAANAFNNNDTAENTSVLYCRITNVGWFGYEGPGRFIKIHGNYLRNSGPFWVGSMNHRAAHLDDLGCGQAVITDNFIEGSNPSSGIWVQSGATQVTIAGNVFVNFNGSDAIRVSANTTGFPSQNVTVSGNIIDLTNITGQPRVRNGIYVNASDVTVSDNEVYVRGEPDVRTTGIRVDEPAVNVNVHDNLIKNCQTGLRTGRASSTITEVVDPKTFAENALPREWPRSDRYRGWQVAWLSGKAINTVSTIDSYDPETLRFQLTQPVNMQVGDHFDLFPVSANWTIHSNAIADCQAPVVLASYGSPTSRLEANVLSRGSATGVKEALSISGRFNVVGNHLVGFDEPGSAGFTLGLDPIGRAPRNLFRANILEHCAIAVRESSKGLWERAVKESNEFLECDTAGR